MKRFYNSLSLALKSDTFYDGVERVCTCLKGAKTKDAFVASETNKLDSQKQQLSETLHYKAAVDDISAETLALRRTGSALRHQISWWMKFGNAEEQACASRLKDIADEYGPFNRLTVRDCRTAAELLLRDFGTGQAMADIAALEGVGDLADQLETSLATLREKQALVDGIAAATVKPESLHELKRGIADTLNGIMEYLVGMVKVEPEAFGTLLEKLVTILDNANMRKRKAAHQLTVVPDGIAAEVPA